MFILLPARLDPKIKNDLQEGALPIAQVREIEQGVIAHRQTKLKGFKLATIIMAVVFVVMAALSIAQMGNAVVIFFFLLTGVVMAGALAFVKWLYVDGLKRQFVRAVRKGYADFPFEQAAPVQK